MVTRVIFVVTKVMKGGSKGYLGCSEWFLRCSKAFSWCYEWLLGCSSTFLGCYGPLLDCSR